MSTSMPSSPNAARPPSSPRQEHGQSETPLRTQSMANRQPNQSNTLPMRANSVSQPNAHPPSSARQAQLANVARRDFEQTNVARASFSSRRSSSVGRNSFERSPTQHDTPRSPHQRSSSRSGQPRYNIETASEPRAQANGTSTDANSRTIPIVDTRRRRTTVTAQTGQWALGKTIGAGSMGKVKLARNMGTGEQVAIKIVPRHSQDDHRSQQERERADHSKEVRTAREAAIVTLVNHPYICGMRDVVRTHYHWYMLFEYVNGGQMLDYIISHGKLKEKQARKFGRQIASALDYCHRNSIVHRDLKIENILISKTGDIKIIDFGLSNLFSPRGQLKTFCGSLYFAAPELLQAKQYTGPEVDIWSFGIVLYVLVCGKVPFDDQSMPQLHAKIKKGTVDYPPFISNECRHIISRMLVTDPRQRASLSEILNHPWLTKGFGGAPENFLPSREPLQMPLDSRVIDKMTGFEFGSADYIRTKLETLIESEDYQKAVRQQARKPQLQGGDSDRKRGGVFDFYQRRKSAGSRDTLANPSTDAIHLGEDPVNAYAPLISIYYLAREKLERERTETNPGALSIPRSPGQKPLRLPDLPPPEAVVTNSSAYEMAGEAPTGGRTRPRARTHGEDEINETTQMKAKPQDGAPPTINEPQMRAQPSKRESTAAGLLRRLSTRKTRELDPEKQKPTSPPSLAVSGPEDQTPAPRQSVVGARKTRERDTPPSAYQNIAENHPDLLAPPHRNEKPVGKLRSLGRSTSVNSADLRRRWSRRGVSEGSALKTPPVTDSEHSSLADQRSIKQGEGQSDQEDLKPKQRSAATRTRSMGHSRRNSFQAGRALRKRPPAPEEDVPEETDRELAEEYTGASQAVESQEALKPVYLKGLFSVSTTSSKPLSFIRSDIIRVLKQIGIDYREMKGGFSCRHLPSIDLNKVVDPHSPESSAQSKQSMQQTHRRKISFAGLRNNEKERDVYADQQRPVGTPKSASRRAGAESAYTTNSEESEDENAAVRQPGRSSQPAGETTTHVQSDLGQSMILKFEILVVKVPFLSLHGLQFKKVDGGTWQYKRMAETILTELRL